MTDRFEDERGVIQDLLGAPIDGITEIFTREGAVRGNHVHMQTTQWTYVVSGRMLAVAKLIDGSLAERELWPGQMLEETAAVPHAWKALQDTKVLVFTRGPRSGAGYESDTVRLKEPILR
ncbi:MAG TPA: cupin domain-containing protein [Acidobacteriaceae bacterium]|nr:cupin domain-containing protein [Acidobacteriaceae bacterium]